MRHKKEQILEQLNRTLANEDALLKERVAALKVLLKYDRENTINKVEDMYEKSGGMAQVQLADLMLRIIGTQPPPSIVGDIDVGDLGFGDDTDD